MDYPEPSTLRDIVRIIVRGLLPAMALGALMAAGVYYLVQDQPERFEATATVLVANSANPANSFDVTLVTAPRIDVQAYEAAVGSGPVLDNALRMLGNSTPTLADRESLTEAIVVQVSEMRDSSLLNLTARGLEAHQAASMANAVAQALLDWDQQRAVRTLGTIVRTLEAQIAGIDAQLADATADQPPLDALLAQRAAWSTQLNSARALMTSAVGRLEILEPASLPIEPVPSFATLLSAAVFLLGVFIVYAIMLVRNAVDMRMRSLHDFATATGVPVITGFRTPRSSELRADPETGSFLRAHVLHSIDGSVRAPDQGRVVVVTSAVRDAGRVKVAVSLAESLARTGMRTLLIDADMRRPSIARIYHLQQGRGAIDLEGCLANPDWGLSPSRVMVANTPDLRLSVIPSSGTASAPSELLGRSFSTLVAHARSDFDVVVIDTPPILEVADALSIAPFSDGVLLVADLKRLTRANGRLAVQALDRIGVRILGAAVSNAPSEDTELPRAVPARSRPEERPVGFGARAAPPPADYGARGPGRPKRT